MNLKDFIGNAATVILVVCAVIITVLIIRREFFPSHPEPTVRLIENWQEIELTGSPTDQMEETVQIIKFYDYECPYCKQVQPAVEAVLERYSDMVNIKYAHFPLDIHDNAWEAALAAECARKQNAFEAYHTLLFERQEKIGTVPYFQFAVEAGVQDVDRFSNCLETRETFPIVEDGVRLANQLNVNMIPSFLINESLVAGALSEGQLEKFIEDTLYK